MNYKVFILFALLSSCDKIPGVSDIALIPENSTYSEKNNLLIERYTYPSDTLKILDDYFVIADAWASHNFKSRESKEINKKLHCVFLFV